VPIDSSGYGHRADTAADASYGWSVFQDSQRGEFASRARAPNAGQPGASSDLSAVACAAN
jgi:hypothetical protein